MQEKAFKIIVTGRVTGVGFRCCAVDYATSLPGLKGHVMNLSRNEVEAFVQGPEDVVGQMVDWLRAGPSWSRIDKFEIYEVPADPHAGPFTIKHSWRY